jgi:nicotinamide-nucleotide amidase
MKLPRAGILTVGDELLGGRVVNTNAAFLTQRLTEQGFLVTVTETVGDEEFAIADAIEALCQRTDAVVVAGGLGPTPDDVTREALAGASGALLVVDDEQKRLVATKTRGVAPRKNLRMARMPEGAEAFFNPVGVAAGLRVDVGGTPVYALPGVPMEMEAIFEQSVVPDLERIFAKAEPPERSVLRVYGLREAEVAERLGGLLDRGKEPSVGVTVKYGLITVSVVGHGAAKRADQIREELGAHVIGEDHDTPATVAYRMLLERGLTLATAESITGGLVAGLFIDQPGASEVFRGGVIAYDDDVKHALLGVPTAVLAREGAVSGEVARRMARAARQAFGVDVAIATTGVAGPTPDERGVPIGRGFLAVAGPRAGKTGEVVEAFSCVGNRNAIRRRFVWTALDLVRRHLARGRSKKVG